MKKVMFSMLSEMIPDGDSSYGQRQRDAERRRLLDVIASETASRVVRDNIKRSKVA